MLATSLPDGWGFTAEEELSVVGDDVAVRIRVEIPPSIAAATHPGASRTMWVGITTSRPATDVLVLFEREDDDFVNPEEARFTEDNRDAMSLSDTLWILGGPCPEDVPCVDETIVILSAEELEPILYDIHVVVYINGDGSNEDPPPGEILLTLEKLDMLP
jgi:hypothetical protein